MKNYLLVLVLLFNVRLLAAKSQGTQINTLNQKIEEIQTEKKNQQIVNEAVEKIQNKIISERESHQQFVEGMFSTFINYVIGIMTVSGLLFVVLTFFFGNNAKEHFKEQAADSILAAKKDILKDLDDLKSEIAATSATLEIERKYLKQNIAFVEESDAQNAIDSELELLRKMGFSVKNIKSSPSDVLIQFSNVLSDADVLIVSATTHTDLVKLFETLNAKLNLTAKRIPLVIYVKGRNESLNRLLEQYPFAMSANMPMTLINSVYTVSKIKSLLKS